MGFRGASARWATTLLDPALAGEGTAAGAACWTSRGAGIATITLLDTAGVGAGGRAGTTDGRRRGAGLCGGTGCGAGGAGTTG